MSRRIKDKILYIGVISSMIFVLVLLCYVYFFKVLEVDLADKVGIIYQGESGYATIEVVNKPSSYDQRYANFLESIVYEVNPKEGVSNGDILTVTAHYDEELASTYNYHVINFEQEIEVKDLPTRFQSVDDIKKELLEEITESSSSYIKTNEKDILHELMKDSKLTKIKISESKPIYMSFMKSNTKNRGDSIFQLFELQVEGVDADNKKSTQVLYYGLEFETINSNSSKENFNIAPEKVDQNQIKEISSEEAFIRYCESKFSLEFNEIIILKTAE